VLGSMRSITTGENPRRAATWQKWLPIYPAPPATRIVLFDTGAMLAAGRAAAKCDTDANVTTW